MKWLLQLKFKEVEEEPEGALLEPLKKFINQPEFLPHHARLKDVASRRVLFVDGTVWWEMKRQHRDIPELRALFRQAPEALGW